MKYQKILALFIGILSITIILIFGSIVFYLFNKYSFIDFYERLETRARIFTRYTFDQDTSSVANLINLKNQHLQSLDNEKAFAIQLQSGLSIDSISAKYDVPKTLLKAVQINGKARERNGEVFYVGAQYKSGSNMYIIIVSASNYYVTHHLIFLRNLLAGSMSIIILFVMALSYYFSKHIFDPIKAITDKVKQISTENIHLRLENELNNNEISELISTFNDLLNRIETAFETQKNFISNASHELGTPLTAIIGEADVALLKTRTNEEYQVSLQNILHQAERLDNITKSLLFLAQTGYKGKADTMQLVRIDEVVWETKSTIDKLNPNNQIIVDLSLLPESHLKLKVMGNKQLLHLALANIMNNACKYSDNKVVKVFIAASDSHIIITIIDAGIGIPKSELDFIYDPFFRASNTKLYEGYGIGLPLARNIIRLHKGILVVESAEHAGTSVQIHIPLAKIS
jgi:signal transduction histidine kinase